MSDVSSLHPVRAWLENDASKGEGEWPRPEGKRSRPCRGGLEEGAAPAGSLGTSYESQVSRRGGCQPRAGEIYMLRPCGGRMDLDTRTQAFVPRYKSQGRPGPTAGRDGEHGRKLVGLLGQYSREGHSPRACGGWRQKSPVRLWQLVSGTGAPGARGAAWQLAAVAVE